MKDIQIKEVFASPYVEDVPNVVEEKIQFIIDLKFQCDNLYENVHDVSLEDKTNVKDDDVIDLSKFF